MAHVTLPAVGMPPSVNSNGHSAPDELEDQNALLHGNERARSRYQAMSDACPLGIVVTDAKGRCLYSNAAQDALTGFTRPQTAGLSLRDLLHPEDVASVMALTRPVPRAADRKAAEARILRSDGSFLWTRVHTSVLHPGHAHSERVFVFEDISARRKNEPAIGQQHDAVALDRDWAQTALDSIGDAVVATDRSGQVTFMNPVAEGMTGWRQQEALGQPLTEVVRIVDGTTRRGVRSPAQCAMEEDRVMALAADCVLVRKDGLEYFIEDSAAPIRDREGTIIGAVMVFHDVSQSRALSVRMAHLAQHDFLTDLPNRALLTERLTQAMGLAERSERKIALLFLDVDHFKHINDSLGHVIGDELLKSVSERLKSCVRTTDTVCRQGGDEFVILLSEVEDAQDAALVAEKIGKAFLLPHTIAGHDLHISLSIGISVFPDDGVSVDIIMQSADTAMYQVKATGRANYKFFESDMNARAVHRLHVESSLRRALRQGEFLLCYQPKINLSTGSLTGTEALIRWLDPMMGIIYPNQFVRIAEESGLIVRIGRWVVQEACRQTRAWLDSGLLAVPVSVNISAVEFRQKDFLHEIQRILTETGLPPSYLELELTESTLMREGEPSAEVLDGLKALGVRLAIDDFGTGYSSLSYLKRFPIDTLKIDQSLVRDIVTDPDGATIVGAVIEMGRNLNQRVIAEGVETPEQLAMLRAQHCEEGQGFQFSHPLSATGLQRLLAIDITKA